LVNFMIHLQNKKSPRENGEGVLNDD